MQKPWLPFSLLATKAFRPCFGEQLVVSPSGKLLKKDFRFSVNTALQSSLQYLHLWSGLPTLPYSTSTFSPPDCQENSKVNKKKVVILSFPLKYIPFIFPERISPRIWRYKSVGIWAQILEIISINGQVTSKVLSLQLELWSKLVISVFDTKQGHIFLDIPFGSSACSTRFLKLGFKTVYFETY